MWHKDAYSKHKGLLLFIFWSSPRGEDQMREPIIQGFRGVVSLQTIYQRTIIMNPVLIHNLFTYSTNQHYCWPAVLSLNQILAVCQVASSYQSKLHTLAPLLSSVCQPTRYVVHPKWIYIKIPAQRKWRSLISSLNKLEIHWSWYLRSPISTISR